MKKREIFKRIIIIFGGILFAVYSAYNIFIIVRDGKSLLPVEKFISALVAFSFLILAIFVWTYEVKNIRFIMLRIYSFIAAMLVLTGLKIRIGKHVINYIDFSKPETILYGIAYFFTVAAMIILLFYYVFIIRRLSQYPKLSFVLPLIAMILFLSGFIAEIILLSVYHIGLEASLRRTVVIRPVFYFGFIFLSVYFLFVPRVEKEKI